MRDRLMVGQRTLDPSIGVRLPVPQHFDSLRSLNAIALIKFG